MAHAPLGDHAAVPFSLWQGDPCVRQTKLSHHKEGHHNKEGNSSSDFGKFLIIERENQHPHLWKIPLSQYKRGGGWPIWWFFTGRVPMLKMFSYFFLPVVFYLFHLIGRRPLKHSMILWGQTTRPCWRRTASPTTTSRWTMNRITFYTSYFKLYLFGSLPKGTRSPWCTDCGQSWGGSRTLASTQPLSPWVGRSKPEIGWSGTHGRFIV